ncbi:MAG: hypothetical protein ABS68_05300 [Niastella sp. SCN 39-18]|nr:carboxypeptidase-like regulatory domain-containing protein [Sphingobacteriales bacterium]ODT53497.1 MAG: hypothetical protein ABS68_05300 [Niastella sp. SCN 39-18]OJW11463.1 MAG: hypothetical protein BGO53_11005 [Sphingobacteriales bacterium 39-19]
MKNLLYLVLFIPLSIFGQLPSNGTITDSKNGKPVPFATIALKKENRGVNADLKGRFEIAINDLLADTLVITSVGYKKRMISVLGTVNNLNIALEPDIYTLKKVVVKKRGAEMGIGLFKTCSNAYMMPNDSMWQLAKYFNVGKENQQLIKIKICTRTINSTTKFRLRIYNIDSTNQQPAENLCNEIIEATASGKITTVDVKKYQIYIPQKEFFIAIEWIAIPENLVKLPTLNLQNDVMIKTYYPYIGSENFQKNISFENHLWQLNYSGYWKPFVANSGINILISAILE